MSKAPRAHDAPVRRDCRTAHPTGSSHPPAPGNADGCRAREIAAAAPGLDRRRSPIGAQPDFFVPRLDRTLLATRRPTSEPPTLNPAFGTIGTATAFVWEVTADDVDVVVVEVEVPVVLPST